jgi:endonuclease/exonuclease/phosphatase (EEP) superfamily protein YafD
MVTFVLLAKQVPGAEEWPEAATADFTVAFGNLLSRNRVPDEVVQAMADSAADVLVLVEFTPWMRDTLHAICGDRYPHRFESPLPNPAGIGVWSRLPFERTELLTTVDRPTIDVDLRTDAGTVRLLALHTITPTLDAPGWVAEIAALGAVADGPSPTLIVGDFNAARWHPTFRSLLAAGWRSAHEAVGQGWSPSWPAAHYPLPIFVRVDHALARGLSAVDVRDFDLPGSDHRGFVAGFSVCADRISGWNNPMS